MNMDAKKAKLDILLQEEDQLVRVLSQKDAKTLSEQFRKRYVFDDTLFHSLDYEAVSVETLVRYLLNIVTRDVGNDKYDTTWDSFLAFIGSFGGNFLQMKKNLKEKLKIQTTAENSAIPASNKEY